MRSEVIPLPISAPPVSTYRGTIVEGGGGEIIVCIAGEIGGAGTGTGTALPQPQVGAPPPFQKNLWAMPSPASEEGLSHVY